MRTESLVDRLSQDLRPVRRRSIVREALLLLLLAVVEIAAFLGMGFMRPDMPVAMEAPSFWWKLTSMGLIAVLGRGCRDPVGRSGPVASSRPALDSRLHRRDPRQRLADRRGGQWTRGPGSPSRLDARSAMRLEDGGAIDSSSHRPGRADTARRTDRPSRNRARRRALVRRLGRFRLRLRLSLG